MLASPYPVGRGELDSNRRTASLAGWLFVVTFVVQHPGAARSLRVRCSTTPTTSPAPARTPTTCVALGALLEMLLIVANVGTAVVLFPILKRQNEAGALGYVTARLVESTFIAIGIVSLLAILTVRDDGTPGANGRPRQGAHRDPRLDVPARAGLHRRHRERAVAGLPDVPVRLGAAAHGHAGLIGGPLIVASGILVLFDVIDPGSPVQVLATIPEFIWELSLGIYLIVKGFRPCPILDADGPRSRDSHRPRSPFADLGEVAERGSVAVPRSRSGRAASEPASSSA